MKNYLKAKTNICKRKQGNINVSYMQGLKTSRKLRTSYFHWTDTNRNETAMLIFM